MNAAVVYWSGTGNTEAMAQAVAEGIQAAGGTAEVCEVGQTDADTISKFDKIALGCPSMGAEQLEDKQEEPRRYVRSDRQMRIRFQNLIKLRSAARLWEQSSWKTAKWSRSWKNWSR